MKNTIHIFILGLFTLFPVNLYLLSDNNIPHQTIIKEFSLLGTQKKALN